MPDPQVIEKLNRLIESGPFEVHIARTFPLDQAAEAHRALETHYPRQARPAAQVKESELAVRKGGVYA